MGSMGPVETAINPFHSEKAQREHMLAANRPRELPELSPGSDVAPLRNDSWIGKGRGGQSSGRVACFVTPPSNPSVCSGDGDETGQRAKQTEGRMPDEATGSTGLMKDVKHQLESESSSVDSLQRALEIEIVQQLREQNARLLEELAQLRQSKSSPVSGDGSSSWVEIQGE